MDPLPTTNRTQNFSEDPRLAQLHRILGQAQARLRLQEAVSLMPLCIALSLPAALALAAVFAAVFVPIPGAGLFGNNGPVRAQVSNERQQIEELKKAIASQPSQANDPARQALLKELDELSRALARGDLTKEE